MDEEKIQNSVWVTPDPVIEERAVLDGGPVNVESLILIDGKPSAGESDADRVNGSWDWPAIDRRYARYREILSRRPLGELSPEAAAQTFQSWMRAERSAWIDAVRHDPLLPASLLPKDYSGRCVWHLRLATMKEATEQMCQFRPTSRG